jgi:hypothetical protein
MTDAHDPARAIAEAALRERTRLEVLLLRHLAAYRGEAQTNNFSLRTEAMAKADAVEAVLAAVEAGEHLGAVGR